MTEPQIWIARDKTGSAMEILLDTSEESPRLNASGYYVPNKIKGHEDIFITCNMNPTGLRRGECKRYKLVEV